MGGTGRGDLRGSSSCPTVDNQYVCYVRIFHPVVFWVRILKKDIFMVIVARLFYYIFM
jgi:hypothetical protein